MDAELDEVLYSGDLIASQDQIGINKVDIEDVQVPELAEGPSSGKGDGVGARV